MVLSSGQIIVPQDLLQGAGFYMARPLGRAFGGHHDVIPRSTGPNVQVFPFEKRINRVADMEGECMRLGPKEEDELRRRRPLTNLGRKALMLSRQLF